MAKDSNIPSTHPLTPPLTEEAWLDWFRLLRSRRVGVSTFFRLMHEFGSAGEALSALPEIAAKAGVENYEPCTRAEAEREMAAGVLAGAKPVAYGSNDYPDLLAEIIDPPPILWSVGDLAVLDRPLTALVGARNASSLGTRMAKKLAAELGELGHVVVSGLARGIDTAAHLATLKTGTVAVMPGGVDVVYPKENAVLMQEVAEQGLVLSERPMHADPMVRHFPIRNRIITGLCKATVVIEASAKSGSHGTARTALDQGREVLAVPGHPFDARSAGCNMLIRDGATLLRNARDLVEALSHAASVQPKVDLPEIESAPAQSFKGHALHAEILARLTDAPIPEDEIIRSLDQPAEHVGAALVTLELDGKIARDAAGRLILSA